MSSGVVTTVVAGLILAGLLAWLGIKRDGGSTAIPQQAAPTLAQSASTQEATANTTAQAIAASTIPRATTVSGIEKSSFVGGCKPFTVFAQNQWDDPGVGARLSAEPYPKRTRIGGFGPNVQFDVDGWVRTVAPYPTNPEPFNSDVWFHVPNPDGWVAYAAVRSGETELATTGQADEDSKNDDLGVALDPECEGEYRPR